MIGLLFLAGLCLWVWVCFIAARALVRRLPAKPWRPLVGLVAFAALFVAPVADEIVGGIQFRAMCEREAVLTIDAAKVRGRTLKEDTAWSLSDNTVLRVMRFRHAFIDPKTGEDLGSYVSLTTGGGWLFRSLGLPGKPMLFYPSACWPEFRGKLDETYQFSLIKD